KKGLFKDAIVVVGPMARIFQDRHRTPFAQDMLGPLIHVNILAAALDRAFLTEAPPLTNFFLSLWAGMVAWLLAWRFSNLLYRFFVAGLSAILYLVLSQLLYDHADTFVAVTSPMLSLMGSTAISMVNDFAQARRDKAQLRRTLERYVSKDVVRELLDNPQTYLHSLTGVRRRVTILFSDVRGFTTMTEAADASLLVKQLNEYFQQMVDIVVKNRGRLDKFIGDAVMADWGSFVTTGHEADAERAVLSAIQMREALKRLNSMWSERGAPPLAFGIGINHGEVIVGNLGSEEKMEVSIIGDAVNLASRLESLTKEYGVDLLLGETVAQLVKDRIPLRTVDWVTVKGKTKPVEVFTITPGCTDIRSIPEWLSLHEQSVRQYRQQEFGPALAGFEQLLARDPNDGLAEVYINRCRSLIANPPGPGWTGVFEAKKK
ncbi:MAG: adenylate/guanylate cyclase domain-containing protein, partial [Verrucomicrobia bacterium]|nr:adenylate/guanylate cyclase domain-containing protein [Verrucomicrobiota bacterium]